jgi:hypothetical protein
MFVGKARSLPQKEGPERLMLNSQALELVEKACPKQTLQLIEPIHKLRRK